MKQTIPLRGPSRLRGKFFRLRNWDLHSLHPKQVSMISNKTLGRRPPKRLSGKPLHLRNLANRPDLQSLRLNSGGVVVLGPHRQIQPSPESLSHHQRHRSLERRSRNHVDLFWTTPRQRVLNRRLKTQRHWSAPSENVPFPEGSSRLSRKDTWRLPRKAWSSSSAK